MYYEKGIKNEEDCSDPLLDTRNFLGLCLFLVSAFYIEDKSLVALLRLPLILEKETKQVKKPQEFFVNVKLDSLPWTSYTQEYGYSGY